MTGSRVALELHLARSRVRFLVLVEITHLFLEITVPGGRARHGSCTPRAWRAGRAPNPKGPQVTPFCHQMGRHPTIWDFKTGIWHRIPARISPWGFDPDFVYFGPKSCKKYMFWQGFEFIGTHSNGFGPNGGPRVPLGGPRAPQGDPWAPGRPRPPGRPGGPWDPWGPCCEVPLGADYTGS